MKWIDSTSYSRGERGTVEPRAWQLEGCKFRVQIHGHINYPGVWFVSAEDLRIERAQLLAEDVEVAKVAAVAYIRARLKALSETFEKAVKLT